MNKNLVKATLALTIFGSLVSTGVHATSFENEGTKVTIEKGKPLLIEYDGTKKLFNNGESVNYDPNIQANNDGAYSVEYTEKGQIISSEMGIVELDNNGNYRIKDSEGNIVEEKNIENSSKNSTEEQILKEVREVKKIVNDKPKIIEKPIIVEKDMNNIQEDTIDDNVEEQLAMGTISFIAKVPKEYDSDVTVKFSGNKYEDSIILNKQNNYYFSKPLNIGVYSITEVKTENNDDVIKYDANVINVYAEQDTKKNITIEFPKTDLEETLEKEEAKEQDNTTKNGMIFPIIILVIIGVAGFFIYKNKDKILYKDQF